jgi:hypothetical protein
MGNSSLNDEAVFQIGRNWVIGLLIVIKDFAKIILGESYNSIIGKYNGYKSKYSYIVFYSKFQAQP